MLAKFHGYVCAGLASITAEREDAIRRADEAEDEMRKLADQRNILLRKLEGLPDSPSQGLSTSAPAGDSSSAGFGPAPESGAEGSSDLKAQVPELTPQYEAIATECSELKAELATTRDKLKERDNMVSPPTRCLYVVCMHVDSIGERRYACGLVNLDFELSWAGAPHCALHA